MKRIKFTGILRFKQLPISIQKTRPGDNKKKEGEKQLAQSWNVPSQRTRVKIKEGDKKEKYLDLVRKLRRPWNMRVTVIPIVFGALGKGPKKKWNCKSWIAETIRTTALSYLPNPSARAGYVTRSIFKRRGWVNSTKRFYSMVFQSWIYIYIFTNPSARAGYDTRSIFLRSLTGLNSDIMLSQNVHNIQQSHKVFMEKPWKPQKYNWQQEEKV